MHPPSRLVGANRPPRPRRRSPRRDSSRLSPTTIPSSARTPLWSWLGGRKARSSTDSDARTRPERVSSARTCSSARKADPSRQLPPSPGRPSPIIRIDGDFSDWAKFPTYSINPTGAIQNPAVNLQAIKVAAQDQELFVYARVQGLLFQGAAANETDSLFVFLDQDNNRLTGYPIGDLGADAMVEVTGWQDYRGIQHQVTSYLFDESVTPRSNDWNRFRPGGSAEAAFSGSQLELRTSVSSPGRTRVLVYSADNLGERAPADGSVQVGRATRIVRQPTIGPDIVAGPNITMLRITLTPMGGVTSLTTLNLTRLGSSTDPVNLSLYRDDGSGVLDPADRLLAVAPMAGTAASLTMSESVGAPAVR